MKKALFTIITSLFLFSFTNLNATTDHTPKDPLEKSQVLVYTKNGKGYVHDNIPAAVISIKEMADAFHFKVDVSDDPAVFTQSNLQQYKLIIFTSTNNDVFDNDIEI